MPAVDVTVRWADGTAQRGVAPSRAIERYVVAGGLYPRAELEQRLSEGLAAASERVRERFGFACTAAAETAEAFAVGAREHGGDAGATATVERVRRHGGAVRRGSHQPLPGEVDVLVIGGGQAGLSLSWHLTAAGIEHLVLERERAGGAWTRGRWDSFCLVTPNWQCRLPGHPYAGDDPDGFMVREQIVDYVESFARSFDAPLREGVSVARVSRGDDGRYVAETSDGVIRARQVALCVSGYHVPRASSLAARLPAGLTQLHSSQYRNPGSLPDGAVLVVGTGQSGAQIAEDLWLGGREVHLSVGSAPRCARRYRGRDCIAWLQDIGHYDLGVTGHPRGPDAARHEPNHYMTGRDGGHDLDLRAFARDGMALHGRLTGVAGEMLQFAGDLPANLDRADATAERIKDTIDAWIEREGIDAPAEPRYTPVWRPEGDGSASLSLHDAGVRSVIWATGFDADWSFVDVAGFLGGDGSPAHERGVCRAADELYVLGLPWLWTWGSGRLAGIARDAEHVAQAITRRAHVAAA